MIATLLIQGAVALTAGPSPAGPWNAVLDLAGGQLPFVVTIESETGHWRGELCNGSKCQPFSAVHMEGDSLVLEIADYAAIMKAVVRADSLVGYYHNVGSNGPRTIPFRAARGRPPTNLGSRRLLGRWDATYSQDQATSRRVFEFRNVSGRLEGWIISSTTDYGPFTGPVAGDSFAIGLFDGSFVYLLAGKLEGDTLRGVFHAGLRTQTPWTAVRSTAGRFLQSPTEVTGADTSERLRFSFPDLDGRQVGSEDPRFRGRVVLLDVFGTWCPTCHEATPELVRLYRRYHARGLEIVGLAFEVTGDTAVDAAQVRRYRDKFAISFPLLLAGVNDNESLAAALPQLRNLTAFPTAVFLGRDGRVRRVYAGFHGLASGSRRDGQSREFAVEIERLLEERPAEP